MKQAKRIAGILFLLTVIFALWFVVQNLIHYDPVLNSFPRWSCFVFAGINFGPVLVLEAAGWLLFRFLEKRKK